MLGLGHSPPYEHTLFIDFILYIIIPPTIAFIYRLSHIHSTFTLYTVLTNNGLFILSPLVRIRVCFFCLSDKHTDG